MANRFRSAGSGEAVLANRLRSARLPVHALALVAGIVLAGCGSQGLVVTPSNPPTRQASLAEAQWGGTWEFRYTLTNLEGVAEGESPFDVGSQIRRIWEVEPGCPDGPCNSQIVARDPDQPVAEAVTSVITYHEGSYLVTQTFPPEPQQGCAGPGGRRIPGAFEATNVVEVTPTNFETRDGETVVTELFSTKVTTFRPTGSAALAGGSCTVKVATWEGTVVPVAG
ncbi:MAG: hypothetical protein ACT4OM_13675 [Actinomycetota bacterium]